jgi:hypothetical protein
MSDHDYNILTVKIDFDCNSCYSHGQAWLFVDYNVSIKTPLLQSKSILTVCMLQTVMFDHDYIIHTVKIDFDCNSGVLMLTL